MDEVFTIEQAAAFMGYGKRTIYYLIKRGMLVAARMSKRGRYRILRSSCIACIRDLQQNESVVGGVDRTVEEKSIWPSHSGEKFGTVVSLRQTERALDAALAPRTKNKPRNTTIS